MSVFGSLSKFYFGESKAKKVQAPGVGDIWQTSFGVPFLQQSFSLVQALGMTPEEAFGKDYIKSGNGPGGQISPGSSLEWISLGGGKYANISAMMKKFPELTQKAEQKQQEMDISSFNKSWDLMQTVPALQGIVGEAKGQFGAKLTQDLSQGFDILAQKNLGSAANAGFLSDPLTQAKVLGPLAMQKSMTEYEIQKKAQTDLLNLAGGGYLAGTSPLGGTPYQNMLSFQPGINAAQGFLGNMNQYNATASQQAKQFNINTGLSFFNTLASGASSGATGAVG